tara:strand:+ start:4682 stop:4936 length:255 start_codon:yes stop_codon:yes gene_type:complete
MVPWLLYYFYSFFSNVQNNTPTIHGFIHFCTRQNVHGYTYNIYFSYKVASIIDSFTHPPPNFQWNMLTMYGALNYFAAKVYHGG